MKFNYCLKGLKLLETSKDALLKDMSLFIKTNNMFSSLWLLDNTVHVLCRHATIFSGRDPIVIIANSCSFDYVEFIKKIPLYYDVYCFNLPGRNLNPILKEAHYSNDYCVAHLNTVISLLRITNYTLMCESFGAGLVIESIVSNHLNVNKISNLILINFEPRSIYFWTRIKISILQITTRNCWSSLLFSIFLYSRPYALDRIRAVYNFVSERKTDEFKTVDYTITNDWYDLERDIIYLSEKVRTTLVESSEIGYSNAASLSERGGKDLHVVNVNLLHETASSRTVIDFFENIYSYFTNS